MSTSSFQQVERIADQIGANAALKLSAFFGGTGRVCYIPVEATTGHVLEKIIGEEAFRNIVAAFAGETLWLPMVDLTPLRNAGRIWMLRESELSNGQIANLLGISRARVGQIVAALRLDGFADLAAELEGNGMPDLIARIRADVDKYTGIADECAAEGTPGELMARGLAASACQLADMLIQDPTNQVALDLAAPWMEGAK